MSSLSDQDKQNMIETYRGVVYPNQLDHMVLYVEKKIICFQHVMYNSETNHEIANTELKAAHIDRIMRKACPLPDNINKRYRELRKFI